MIYAVVYTKGGVGKTTTAVHLAAYLAKRNRVLLIDGDVQASAAVWASWRHDMDLPRNSASPTTIALRGKAILDEGRVLATQYDHTIIDAGGRDSAAMRAAMLLADRLIIPMGGSGFDAEGVDGFTQLIEDARVFNPDLDARILLNRIDPRSNDVRDLRDYLDRRPIPYFNRVVGNRRVYARAVSHGLTAEEYRPRVGAAIYEMTKLYEEINQWH